VCAGINPLIACPVGIAAPAVKPMTTAISLSVTSARRATANEEGED
jgi:hypothetical protein